MFSRQKGKRGERFLCASLRKHGFTDVKRTVVNHNKTGYNPDVVATDPATGIVWKFENKHWEKVPSWLNKLMNPGFIGKSTHGGKKSTHYMAFNACLVALAWKPQNVINITDVIFEQKEDNKLLKKFKNLQTHIKGSDVLTIRGNYMQPIYIRFWGPWGDTPS